MKAKRYIKKKKRAKYPSEMSFRKGLGLNPVVMQSGGDYNIERALELGYTPDEEGHYPSVDFKTGNWLKSKQHPTAWMEALYGYQLNPEVYNNFNVIYNPEGHFGDNQLQYVPKQSYQTGGLLKTQGVGATKKSTPQTTDSEDYSIDFNIPIFRTYIDSLKANENDRRAGWDSKKGRWFPHSSVEGGNKTIAYGHKLLNTEDFSQGLTEQQAEDLMKKDLHLKVRSIDRLLQNDYNIRFKDLTPQQQVLLLDFQYNPGLTKFPKFTRAVLNNDYDAMMKEHMRYSNGKPLGRRNRWIAGFINEYFNPSIKKQMGGAINTNLNTSGLNADRIRRGNRAKTPSVFENIMAGLYGVGEGVLDTMTHGLTDELTDLGFKGIQSATGITGREAVKQRGIAGWGNLAGAVGTAIIAPSQAVSSVGVSLKGIGEGVKGLDPDSEVAQISGESISDLSSLVSQFISGGQGIPGEGIKGLSGLLGGGMLARNGGKFYFQQGGMMNNNLGLTEIKGPTHEQGGVTLPNSGNSSEIEVEGNETIYTPENYVMSDTIKATKPALKAAGLPEKYAGKTYAQISKLIKASLTSKLRPTDPLTKRVFEQKMKKLIQAHQIDKKAKEESDIIANSELEKQMGYNLYPDANSITFPGQGPTTVVPTDNKQPLMVTGADGSQQILTDTPIQTQAPFIEQQLKMGGKTFKRKEAKIKAAQRKFGGYIDSNDSSDYMIPQPAVLDMYDYTTEFRDGGIFIKPNIKNSNFTGSFPISNMYQMGGEMMIPQQQQQMPSGGQEQLMQMVAQALSNGTPPEQIIQGLVQQGIDKQQAVQIVEMVMQQLSGQQQQMPMQQQGMPEDVPQDMSGEQAAPPNLPMVMRKGGKLYYQRGSYLPYKTPNSSDDLFSGINDVIKNLGFFNNKGNPSTSSYLKSLDFTTGDLSDPIQPIDIQREPITPIEIQREPVQLQPIQIQSRFSPKDPENPSFDLKKYSSSLGNYLGGLGASMIGPAANMVAAAAAPDPTYNYAPKFQKFNYTPVALKKAAANQALATMKDYFRNNAPTQASYLSNMASGVASLNTALGSALAETRYGIDNQNITLANQEALTAANVAAQNNLMKDQSTANRWNLGLKGAEGIGKNFQAFLKDMGAKESQDMIINNLKTKDFGALSYDLVNGKIVPRIDPSGSALYDGIIEINGKKYIKLPNGKYAEIQQ